MTKTSPESALLYRPDIDALRAFSILAVVFYHLGFSGVPGGFLGVDVFFVISGFVITNSLFQDRSSSITDYILNFYSKRMKRILPALLFCLISSLLIFSFMLSSSYLNTAFKTSFYAVVGFSNIYLFLNSIDYWGTVASINPFTHTWSLGVEEQFYLIFPVFMWLASRRGTPGGKSLTKTGLILLVSGIAASLILYVKASGEASPAAFYLMPHRLWEIGLGAAISILTRQFGWKIRFPGEHGAQGFGWLRELSVLLLLALLVFVVCTLQKASAFWQAATFGMALGTITAVFCTGLLILVLDGPSRIRACLEWRPVVYIGKISYSLYLWHWVVIVFFLWLPSGQKPSDSLQLVLMFALAAASYHYVENPLRYRPWGARPLKTVFIGLVALVVSLGTLFVTYSAGISRMSDAPSNIWAQGARMIHNDYRCHTPKWSQDPITDCLLPQHPEKKTLYVMGDSHSTNLVPSLIAANQDRYEIRYLGDADFIMSLIDLEHQQNCTHRTCHDELMKRIEFVKKNVRKDDIVIVATSRDIFFADDFKSGEIRALDSQHKKNMPRNLTDVGRAVTANGGRFYLMDYLPKLCSHADYAIGKATHPDNPCSGKRSESLEDRKEISATLHQIAGQVGGTVLDPHPVLCPGEICTSTFRGKVYSWDGSPHFLTTSPDILKEFFEEALFQ